MNSPKKTAFAVAGAAFATALALGAAAPAFAGGFGDGGDRYTSHETKSFYSSTSHKVSLDDILNGGDITGGDVTVGDIGSGNEVDAPLLSGNDTAIGSGNDASFLNGNAVGSGNDVSDLVDVGDTSAWVGHLIGDIGADVDAMLDD